MFMKREGYVCLLSLNTAGTHYTITGKLALSPQFLHNTQASLNGSELSDGGGCFAHYYVLSAKCNAFWMNG